MAFNCYYCPQEWPSFSSVVNHLIEEHPNDEIKFRKKDGKFLKTINFKIIPELAREQGREITIIQEKERIHLSRSNIIPKDSLYKKVIKFQNEDCEAPLLSQDNDCKTEIPEIGIYSDEHILNELVSLLPAVIKALKDDNKLDEYLAFNRLLSEGRFPLNNIAFVLFLDVVRWFDLDKSTNFMRYSEDVKLFWRTGLRLFKGRFLRYMGGPKHKGQVVSGEAVPGIFRPESSQVNFVVPDRRTLIEEEQIVINDKPSILSLMIEVVVKSEQIRDGTFKICVDGKKINPCSAGEIDLWNYEDPPTYSERQNRLQKEYEFFEKLQDDMEHILNLGHENLLSIRTEEKESIVLNCRKGVTILSERVKDLRHLMTKKEMFLQKMTDKCATDWRESKYAMVISSVRTSMHQIKIVIEDSLHCIDNLCQYAASLSGTSDFFDGNTHVHMQEQGNFVCIAEYAENSVGTLDSALVKQRSNAWHQLRDKCLITGSTINKAIGLDGLKKQQVFIDEKLGRTPKSEISEELQKMFDYGTKNEINAVAMNHMFDCVARAKRKAQRKTAYISNPDAAAKGVAPVRQYHKCDESKILPHRRLGIDLE